MNGIAGGMLLSPFDPYTLLNILYLAFSEMVPVLHLVGVPSTVLQKDKPILHHTLGDGRFVVLIKSSLRLD